MQEWKAEVTISGISAPEPADLEALNEVVHGVVSYKARTGELRLVYAFSCESSTIAAAIEHASFLWRAALGNASGIEMVSPDVSCTDFRVCRAPSEAEAEAELKKIFKD